MQVPLYDLVEDPLGAVRSTFEKAIESGMDPMSLEGNDWGAIDLFRKFLIDENGLSQVPCLNLSTIKLLEPNTLVMFRGMVQSMLGNELYIGTYKDGSAWRTNKFMDVSQSRKDTYSDVKIWERHLLYCVPVPGQKTWTEISYQKCTQGQWRPEEKRRRSDDQSPKDVDVLNYWLIDQIYIWAWLKALVGQIQASDSSKMSKHDISYLSPWSISREKQCREGAASSSAFSMNPAAGSDALPCLVKIYESPEFELKLNDMFEFIGVLTFDSEFQAKDDQHNELSSDICEASLIHLRQNKVPRLHCIIHRKLAVPDFPDNSPITEMAGQREGNEVPQIEERHLSSHLTPRVSPQIRPSSSSPHISTPDYEVHDFGDKIVIQLDGYNGLSPSHKVSSLIWRAIENKLDCFFPSYSKVDKSYKQMFFREFQKWVTFDPALAHEIRRRFNHRAVTRWSDNMRHYRLSREKPSWMSNSLWVRFCQHWQSETFQKASQINKLNRNSSTGGSLHTCGSRSLAETEKLMEKELGRRPTPDELYRRTHTKKGSDQWVESRAAEIYNEYQEMSNRMETQYSQRSSNTECSNNGHPISIRDQIWFDTVGGRKRGRVLGMGQSERFKKCSSQKSSAFASRSHEVNEFRSRLAKTSGELAELRAKHAKEMHSHQQQLEALQQMILQLQKQIQQA